MSQESQLKKEQPSSIEQYLTLDNWFEIFSHLSYSDLLNLTLVNNYILQQLNNPAMKSVWINAAFHQSMPELIELFNQNAIDRKKLKQTLKILVKFFKVDKKKKSLDEFYYCQLSRTEHFQNFNDILKIYKKINDIAVRCKKISARNLKKNAESSRRLFCEDLFLVLFTWPPMGLFFAITMVGSKLLTGECLFAHDGEYEQYPRLDMMMLIAAAVFPPLWFVFVAGLIYRPIKYQIDKYMENKYEKELEDDLDEFKASMEELIANHTNKPINDPTLQNNQFDPTVLQQREDLIVLLMSEKFENTNSTGIKNIQNAILEYPRMSCNRFFTLVQTEIQQRTSISRNWASSYKDCHRNHNMQLLYNKVNGGQFGTDVKMDLINSFNDRANLIKFIKETSSFVFKPTVEISVAKIPIHLGIKCVA